MPTPRKLRPASKRMFVGISSVAVDQDRRDEVGQQLPEEDERPRAPRLRAASTNSRSRD